MDETIQKLLREKAREIQNYLMEQKYQCSAKLISYGINFTIYLAGRYATFTLYYKPAKARWTSYTQDEWAQSEILPRIDKLLGQRSATKPNDIASHITEPTENTQSSINAVFHFKAALECFNMLEPFAEEYIDFSIICEQAKHSIKQFIADSRFKHLNKPALQAMLTIPPSSDFTAAKEYLSQCLTLCQIQMPL